MHIAYEVSLLMSRSDRRTIHCLQSYLGLCYVIATSYRERKVRMNMRTIHWIQSLNQQCL
jgi:hypothetical protein